MIRRLLTALLIPLAALAQLGTAPLSVDRTTNDLNRTFNAPSGFTLTIKSGAGLTAASGSTLTIFGTAITSYAEFRTALGLVIGTNVQAYDADLTTYAGITPSANVQTLLGSADYAAFRTSLSLVIGTNVQAYDADLTTYAGITPSANVQTLLGSADYAAFKTSLSLNNVENTALSTWAGTTNVTTLGTIGTGTWQGAIVAPAYLGTGSSITTKYLRGDGTWQTIAGTGDVVGPGSATDNAIVRFDSTTGKLVQNSAVKVTDDGAVQFQDVGLGLLKLMSSASQTNNHTITFKSNDADSALSFNGNVTLASSFTTSGANALTLTTTAATSVTLPTSGVITSELLTATTASGNITLTGASYRTQQIDANGADRAVTLPEINASPSSSQVAPGAKFTISNTASGLYGLNVKNNAGTQFDRIDPGQSTTYIAQSGGAWKMERPARTRFIVFGDSLSSSSGWPEQLSTVSAQFGEATLYNYAAGGETASNIASYAVATLAPLARWRSDDRIFLFVFAGINDLGGPTPATIYGYLQTAWDAGRDAGAKVYAFTISPNSCSTIFSDTANKLTLNALILSDPTLFDGAARPEIVLPDATDTTYYNGDQLHYITAGKLKLAQHVRDVLDGRQIQPRFQVLASGTQTITATTDTKLANWYRVTDSGYNFSEANDRFTVSEPGAYRFSASAYFMSVAATKRVVLTIFKNGSAWRRIYDADAGGTTYAQAVGSVVDPDARAGDYYEAFVYHNDTTSRDINAGTTVTWFCGECINGGSGGGGSSYSSVDLGSITGLGTGVATFLGTPSSANLASAVTGETGTGALTLATEPTFTTSISLGSAGVKLSDDGDGALTILGLGDGSDEDIKLNLDDTANAGVFTSSTGLNKLTFTSIDLEVPTEAYDATGWNGDNTVPTKDAVRDKIEAIVTTLATEQATTSGTSIDFTGIPAGVTEITVMFVGVSTNGTSEPLIQIGDSGGVEATGYVSVSSQFTTSTVTSSAATTGWNIKSGAAAATLHGAVKLSRENATHTWCIAGKIARGDSTVGITVSGTKTLSAELDRVRITSTNGTDTLDAGAANISYH